MVDEIKPKRGRKSKKNDENTDEVLVVKPEPKKRGRKPKVQTLEEKKNLDNVEPKKRGRKPKEKVYGKQSDVDSVFVNDNVIIHLNVDNISDKSNKSDKSDTSDASIENDDNMGNENVNLENEALIYNPEINEPINSDTIGLNNNHSFIGDINNDEDILSGGPSKNDYVTYPFGNDYSNDHIEHSPDMEIKKKKNNFLMKSFYNTKENGWPLSTDTCCFWCCHSFQGVPCALPIRYTEDKFEVIGCFCQPECAAAYNFNENINSSNPWERYSLLNLMYKKIYNEDVHIKTAPSKLLLNKFGGHLNIKEFREICNDNNKTIQIIEPPMISILSMREEIMLNRSNNIKKKASIMPSLSEEHYKLKRTKPLKDGKNTLDDCMNLTIN